MIHPTSSRRAFLRAGGATMLGVVLAACGDGADGADDGDAAPAATTTSAAGGAGGPTATTAAGDTGEATALTAADFVGLGTCVLLPEQTEGPFYLDDDLVRRDITEGLTGHPLRVGLQVVDESCAALPGAVVDIWHADVDGDYSAFSDGSDTRGDGDGGAATTFLRGSQVTNDEGIAEFATIYPGWYQGRTVHIHLKVHLDDTTVLTSQLYFPEEVNDTVLAEDLYVDRGERDTTNARDGIAAGADDNGTLLTVRTDGEGHLALIVVGVAA